MTTPIEISCWLFMKTMLVYAIFTLPLLLFGVMYLVSLLCALVLGMITICIFCSFVSLLCHCRIKARSGYILLYLALFVAVALTFQLLQWWMDINYWQAGAAFIFPFIAIIAGWIAIYSGRKKIVTFFITNQHA